MNLLLPYHRPGNVPLPQFIESLKYPQLVAPYVHGMRLWTDGGTVPEPGCESVPRLINGGHLPNHFARGALGLCPPWLDGIITCMVAKDEIISVQAPHGTPVFTYYVYDCNINSAMPARERNGQMETLAMPPHCVKMLAIEVDSPAQMMEQVNLHGELWARPVDAPYRAGKLHKNQSTRKRPYLVHLKSPQK